MVYGAGFAHADDIVGHELTHGLTSFTSDLISWYQSGAIDESLSDIFGELIDLSNGKGNDAPAVRWLLGEDLSIGAIRDMESPPAFGDPDRMSSPLYRSGGDDDGGIHTNGGVGNKAAFLLVDGGTFNGRTVTPLGITKTARIYHEANANLLTSGSDYADLYNALRQACANLVGTGGIAAADCTEVDDALLAVEMNIPRLDPPSAPGRPVATPGDASVTLTWPPPVSDGGAAITSHLVTTYRNGALQPERTVGAGTSVTLGGLTNGNAYWFTVRAVTGAFTGPASTTSNSVIPKANQSILFAPIPGKTWGDPDFALSATASPGLPVGFTASGPCTLSGTTVRITDVGSCTITATQFGSATVNAAPAVSQTFTIAKAGQTISFAALPRRRHGDRAFTVTAAASSGLPVSFVASGRCTVIGTSVFLRGAGTCTITASQAGDSRHNPAPSVERSFAITPRVVCRVPQLVGRPLAAARTALTTRHCRAGKVTYAYSRRVPKGKVISQTRAVGRVLAANARVDFVVSRGVRKR